MKISTRTFQIPTGIDSTVSIQIQEDVNIRAENLHLETWGSSLVLARRLHTIEIPNLTFLARTKQIPLDPAVDRAGIVLELGAGTGLVGISAAAIFKVNVMLTDLSPVVPALEKNIALNKDLLCSTGGLALTGILDWRNPSAITVCSRSSSHQNLLPAALLSKKASVILAADTVYDSSHPEMLVNVIGHWLKKGPDSRALIAYPVRVAYLEEIRELWERMEGIGMEVTEEGKEDLPKKEWDDETLIEWCVWKWK